MRGWEWTAGNGRGTTGRGWQESGEGAVHLRKGRSATETTSHNPITPQWEGLHWSTTFQSTDESRWRKGQEGRETEVQ